MTSPGDTPTPRVVRGRVRRGVFDMIVDTPGFAPLARVVVADEVLWNEIVEGLRKISSYPEPSTADRIASTLLARLESRNAG